MQNIYSQQYRINGLTKHLNRTLRTSSAISRFTPKIQGLKSYTENEIYSHRFCKISKFNIKIPYQMLAIFKRKTLRIKLFQLTSSKIYTITLALKIRCYRV